MRLADFAIRRRVTIAMATVAVMLFGVVALSRLKVNLLPDLSYPTLTIRTEIPGAAPGEVENLVTRPVEEAAGVIRNVRTVRSVSRTGQSDVVLEFVWGTDMDYAGIEVRERLDLLQLPTEAAKPMLLRFDPASEPVLRLALVDDRPATGDERLEQLRRFADDRLKPELESIEGSAAIKVSGGFEDEVQVLVDQLQLARLRLGVTQVAQRIGAENVNLSGGRLEQGTQRFLVRTVNEFESLDEMRNAVIATVDGKPVYLRDVARVERGHKDRSAITRYDGRECIELAVYKEGSANTVSLSRAIEARLATLAATLPPGTRIATVYDQSGFISNAVGEVSDAALWGGLLSVLVLYLFLRDGRATLVAGIVIPVTVVGIFVLMYAFGLTLNVMSLGGIALSIGMLIDNSVVILEAIARKQEQGLAPAAAAREGTAEVAMAVTASTLTTVAVFFPLVFVTGIAGQLFRDQALTVTFAQVLSLLASLTLVPMLAAWRPQLAADVAAWRPETFGDALHAGLASLRATLARSRAALREARGPALTVAVALRAVAALLGAALALCFAPWVHLAQRALAAIGRRYEPLLRTALRHRGVVLGLSAALLAATIAALPLLRTELIPQLAQGEFSVRLRLPAGSPLEGTDRVLQRAQAAARAIPGVARVYAVAGTGNRLDANPVDAGENGGEMAVTLQSPATPAAEAAAIAALRRSLDAIPGMQYEIRRPELVSFATPLEVVVSGFEIERLEAAARALVAALHATGRFADLRSTVEGGNPEIQIAFDQERAAQLGLSVRDIADRVVASVRGDVATRYRWRDRKVDVLVRSIDARAASIDEVRDIVVNPGAERPVVLSAVADVSIATGPAEIRRAAQERVAIVSASAIDGDLGAATQVARDVVAATPLPVGVTAVVAGQSEEMQQSFRSLALAFALAVFLVYLVMASQFESLLHPLVILFTIPMGLIGAAWGLLVTGSTVNAVACIGVILLAGIVVNNAIVLVDAINQARDRGAGQLEAIVTAGRLRLRPILITSVSTILGLLPMAFGLGEGAEIRRPMAITVVGGMLIATFMTLIVIPVLYAALERRRGPAADADRAASGDAADAAQPA